MTDYSYKNRQWTPEHVRTLKRLWKLGYLLEAIADRLYPGCTPGAVKSKAYHLSLPIRESDVASRWTPQIEKLLRDRWHEGVAAALIANEIGTVYEIMFTKSAIIGKAHRLKLAPHKAGSVQIGSKNASINARLRKMPSKPHTASHTAFPVQPPIKPTPTPDRASWVTWEALEPGQCRNIWGDPQGEFGYCGKPAIPNQSWCPGCKARVYIQIDTRLRKKDWSDDTKEKIKELQRIIAD